MSEVTIVMSGHGRGEVFIDGEKVPHVTGIEFAAKVNHANDVTVSLTPDKLIYNGVALVDTIDGPSRGRWWDKNAEVPIELRLSYD